MSAEYVVRLLCLSLAALFAVQFATGLAVRLLTPWIARVSCRATPRAATRLMLALRCLPPCLALFVVLAVCVPSYLWLEPVDTGEELGWLCVVGAALAVATWGVQATLGVRKVLQSRRSQRRIAEEGRPVVALAGIWRPRILISPSVAAALPQDQLDMAVSHETAHRTSRDNLKRLLLAFTPGLLPGFSGLAVLEQHWARLSEWAADDEAVSGDPERAIALASALVNVARMKIVSPVLASSMLNGEDLAIRIERLLHPSQPAPAGSARQAWILAALAAGLLALAVRPATLEGVHELLERLVK